MADFKPMLSIGSITIAQRVVATFHQAGIQKIVMVTGFHAVTLERHLSASGVIFLRNENYENTRMFDSVRIGLTYLWDKCDRVLFTPVDIPLFTAGTVRALLDSQAELASPTCQGQTGHPIVIGASLFDRILADSGEQGLKGAVERCGTVMREICVDDPGTLHDADTPADYSALVDETKSVRAAGQRMQLSYSSCRNMIRTLESQLNCILIERTQGGAWGSQSHLTQRAHTLLSRFAAYEQRVREDAEALYEAYFGGVFE